MESVVRHGHRLGKAFRLVVDPARSNRIYVPPIVLFLRMNKWIPITFAGRSKQEGRPFCLGQTQSVVSTKGSHLQGLDRQLQIIDRAGRRGKMKDIIYRPLHRNKLGHIMPKKTESFFTSQMIEIALVARKQIV